MPEKVREASGARLVTDWSGRLLNKRVFDYLQVGCLVRICVYNNQTGGGEAIYVQITKIKDGSLWGIVQNFYRMDDYIDLPTGSTFAFRFTDIIEVPITWQPKRIQRKMKSFLDPKCRGRPITGM